MTPKLMSYNQNDFQSKAHMEMSIAEIEKNVDAIGATKCVKRVFCHLPLPKFGISRASFELALTGPIVTKRPLSTARKF